MASGEENLTKIIKAQQSLTEWLDDINHDKSEDLRKEDNEKRERLKKINRITGLPFDEPTQFEATDLANNSEAHKLYQRKHGEELCALRIIPKIEGLPKLRMRGLTNAKAYEWFKEQEIDPEQYRADYIPHAYSDWATIFIVNEHGIYGEIIEGGHQQLTQGFYDSVAPIVFQYDFNTWTLSRESEGARKQLLLVASHLHVADKGHREKLAQEVGVEFVNEHMKGYFETTDCESFGLWFIDYNKILGDMYSSAKMNATSHSAEQSLSGQTGSPGKASGEVQIVHPDDLATVEFKEGSVLVCEVTTPSYVPLMSKASAIVTDQGGILSHAAIVARELGVPCIVGTQTATQTLQEGQLVEVDADEGVIKLGSNE